MKTYKILFKKKKIKQIPSWLRESFSFTLDFKHFFFLLEKNSNTNKFLFSTIGKEERKRKETSITITLEHSYGDYEA